MSDLKAAPIHPASWQRFWDDFIAKLNEGIAALARTLAEDGVKLTGVDECKCIAVSDLAGFAQMEEERAALVCNTDLKRSVVVTLRSASGSALWELGEVPWLTNRGSFIRGGLERALLGQLSPSPGVFLRRLTVSSSVADVRPARGLPIRLRLQGNLLTIEFGRRGSIDWSTLEKVMQGTPKIKDIGVVARALQLREQPAESDDPAALDQRLRALRQHLEDLELGTLGLVQLNRRLAWFGLEKAAESRLSFAGLTAVATLLREFHGDLTRSGDDPWDLGNLRVRLVDDFLAEAMASWLSAIRRGVLEQWRQSGGEPLEFEFTSALRSINGSSSGSTLFADAFHRWTVGLPLCQDIPMSGSNCVAAAALTRRVTFNGPGGIRIGHERIPRDFTWSHYGRLCPFDTPQSVDVGVTLSLAAEARINDLGLIEAPCYQVRDGKVLDKIDWLSSWDESDSSKVWIAFPDEREALEEGREVYAHRCGKTLERIPAGEVTHIHVSEEAMISLAANLIPYRAHNDAVRMNMACNFLRQALPLSTPTPPVRTGAEERLLQALGRSESSGDPSSLVFGADLFVGYLPWKGWNYEDAIVVSNSAAEVLTSQHFEHLQPIRLGRSLLGQEIAYSTMAQEKIDESIDLERYDNRGIIKDGVAFSPGEAFLLEPSIAWRKKGQQAPLVAHIDGDGALGPGTVDKIETHEDKDGRAWVRVLLRRSRAARLGDKLANRHGHKGVIGRIVPDHEMPYVILDDSGYEGCDCGEERRHRHLQVLINPLSVISRTNLGQLFETRDARSGALAGLPEKVACYDPALSVEQRKLDGEVLVGLQYLMKLDHNAEDKIHARSTDPKAYSVFVQQPLGGRRREGGQRLGEMEVWALQAHGVPHLLQEMLTLKSDNPWSRRVLLEDMATGANEAEPELPEALRTFTAMCYGLGLDLVLVGRDEHRLDPAADKLPPDDAVELRIGLLDRDEFVRTVSKGAVAATLISGRGETLPLRYHRGGLESEEIFGPVADFSCACGTHKLVFSKRRSCEKCGTPLLPRRFRRRRMGHIELAQTIPNPFLLFSTPISFALPSCRAETQPLRVAFDPAALDDETDIVLSGLLGGPLKARLRTKTRFRGELDPEQVRNSLACFIELCLRASNPFKEEIEARLGVPVRVDPTPDERSDFANLLASVRTKAKSGAHAGLEMGEAINRLLDEVSPTGDARSCALEYAAIVNDVFRKAAERECPLDFARSLLKKHPLGELLSITSLPVIPPDLRRAVKLPRVFERNDLTVAYQRVLWAIQDLQQADPGDQQDDQQKLRQLRTKHFLAVARLMCNQRLPFAWRAWNPETRGLRDSLSSVLDGKDGLLVGHLLGKRVDFSGRAVIVPDPELDIDVCTLPFALAIKLYRPLLLERLDRASEKDGEAAASVVDRAKHGDQDAIEMARSALSSLFDEYPVLLNRQPTLHRLGMLAFKPKLGSGSVVGLPSMVTAGFNADFDGDQMAVHLPVTAAARAEAQRLLPSKHLWRPRDGSLALSLSQDIALGLSLAGGGSGRAVARAFESRPGDSRLLADIEDAKTTAFSRASRSGTSFSLSDLEDLGRCTTSGDEGDMAGILKQADNENPLCRIVNSGARGDAQTLVYLAGTQFPGRKGSNLTSGLLLGERLSMAQARRRDIVNTKLATAEGGGLTKQLVGWAQHVLVTAEDCKAKTGLTVTSASAGAGLRRWIYGRVLANDCQPLNLAVGTVIGQELAGQIETWLSADQVREVVVRSPEYCKVKSGVCRACYGVPPWYGRGWSTLSKEDLVATGSAVGLIAAQAAGEPGTQMALRQKHLAERTRGTQDDVIERFRDLLESRKLQELDQHLVGQGVELSVIHLNTLLRGRADQVRGDLGWVARLATPGGDLVSTLAEAAVKGVSDRLRNLRSQTVIGGKAPDLEEVAK